MEPSEAAEHLQRARRAKNAAERTPVPSWTPPLVAISVFAGFAAVALVPGGGWWRLAAVLLALACWAVAGWLVLRVRAGEGIRGLRGTLRSTATTLMVCAVALALSALDADGDLRKILLALGVFAGLVLGYLTAHQKRSRG